MVTAPAVSLQSDSSRTDPVATVLTSVAGRQPTDALARSGVEQPISSSSSSALGSRKEPSYYEEMARLSLQVSEALAYAHKRGVLHSDIKPSSLLLDGLGNVWVTDFGLAKFEEGEDLSQSRDLVGTLRYMAPERFKGVSDRRGDVYAVGATLYELATLQPALEGGDQIRLIEQIVHQPPPPPRQIDRRIPRDLEAIIVKAMAKEPRDRFSTAEEMAEELKRVVEGRPIRSRPVPLLERYWRWRKQNRLAAGLKILAATLTIAIAIISSYSWFTLRSEHGKVVEVLVQTKQAERKARLALAESRINEAISLQRTGLSGQRFKSLDLVAYAADELRNIEGEEGPATRVREQIISALALVDIRPSWRRDTERYHHITADQPRNRYAVLSKRTGEIISRSLDDDRLLLRIPPPIVGWSYGELSFSDSGRLLLAHHFALDGPGHLELVWDLEKGKQLASRRVQNRPGQLHSNDRWWIYCPANSADLVVWDLVADREVTRAALGFVPYQVSVDPSRRRLAANNAQRPQVGIYDVSTGEMKSEWRGQVVRTAIAWSSDDRFLATGDDDASVYVWNVDSSRLVAVLKGHASRVTVCRFAHRGYLLASSSWDGTTRWWDAASGQCLVTGKGSALTYSHDDRELLYVRGTELGSWDLATAREFQTLDPGLASREGNEPAQACYERALQLEPRSPRITHELAWFLLTCPETMRDPNRALDLARKAIALKRDDPDCQRTLALALLQSGQFSQAVLVLDELAGKDQSSSGLDFLLRAIGEAGQGRTSPANRALETADLWRRQHHSLAPLTERKFRVLRAEAEAAVLDLMFPSQPFAL
jgi:hypothetical protein